MSLKLVIGNKNYSSWSLRAWLYLTKSELPFEEIQLALFTPEWATEIRRYSPAGRVPVLIDGEITVWDSLAIMDYLQERYPQALGWPREQIARAHARAIAAEMHSGFLAIRQELPQNIRMRQQRSREDFSHAAQAEIDRVETLWQDGYQRYGGPWLCGDFSIADVMYVPVALRFVTYGIVLQPAAQRFVEAVQMMDAVQVWIQAAIAEPQQLPFIDQLSPATNGPTSVA